FAFVPIASPPPPNPPTITVQPANESLQAGGTARFSVEATGTPPLQYQWKRNGAAIPNATNPTYSLSSVSLADNGAQFQVIVSNSAGATPSSIVTLEVIPSPRPAIDRQPSEQKNVPSGKDVILEVSATGQGTL